MPNHADAGRSHRSAASLAFEDVLVAVARLERARRRQPRRRSARTDRDYLDVKRHADAVRVARTYLRRVGGEPAADSRDRAAAVEIAGLRLEVDRMRAECQCGCGRRVA